MIMYIMRNTIDCTSVEAKFRANIFGLKMSQSREYIYIHAVLTSFPKKQSASRSKHSYSRAGLPEHMLAGSRTGRIQNISHQWCSTAKQKSEQY